MKRSDMLKIVDEVVRKWYDNDFLAEEMLHAVEEAGMQPPEILYWNSKNPKDQDEKGIPKDLQFHPRNGEYLNRWEPEGEPKRQSTYWICGNCAEEKKWEPPQWPVTVIKGLCGHCDREDEVYLVPTCDCTKNGKPGVWD
jgi:hypothetical protein